MMISIKQLLKYLLIAVLLILNFESVAQDISPRQIKKKASEADKLFAMEDYWGALPLYKELADLEPANVKYNNRAGICYFYSSHKTRCIPYFENVLSNWGTDTIAEVYYYLGTSYQMLNKFDKAINYYKLMKLSIKPELSGAGSASEADRYIAQCEQGKIWIENPSSVKINNLGSTVNTENPEYAPVISANEAKLIFTSKRKEGTGKATTPDGFYYEDIFIADKQSEGWQAASNFNPKDSSVKRSIFYIFWSKARKIGGAINTKEHDASIALSPDGQKLFMYRDNFIWESKFDGNKWGKPQMLNSNVNEKRSFQPSCSMTADEKYLYIVSDRPGGFGGKDIYISEKQTDGEWGPAKNAGDTINTEFDEDGPFITPNGKTLYYSSQGHNSMGGYDIFKSEFENGKWGKPQNMGYPTNTGADDIFFVMNANETRAYFASIKEDTYGDYDIYVLSYVPETHLYAYEKDGNTITPMNTVIHSRGSKAPIDTTTYSVSKTPGRHKLLLLNPDKYNLTVEAKGYKTRSIDIAVPNQNYRNPFYQEISYETIKKDGKPYKWITNFYSAYFNVDSVVNADPTLSKMDNRLDAYSAMLKTIDPKNTKLNYKVFTFVDSIVDEVLPVLATNNTNNNNTNNNTNNTNNNTNNNNNNNNNNANNNNNNNTNTTNTTGTNVSADVRQFPPILFDFNKSLLREEVRNELEEITAYLKDNSTLKLEVYGHTDSKGSDKFNSNLSYKRARATVKYFADKGITAVRLKAFGKGERQPVAPNENPDKSDNPDGRQKNRRVEFKVVSPSPKAVK